MRVLPFCLALTFIPPTLCYYHFDSRDSVVSSVIEKCMLEVPNKKGECYNILRCIIDKAPSDYSARWSSGASILAFIPTIAALLSNSINEVSSIADESVLLAVALSLSSVTAFNYRFRDKNTASSDTIFAESSLDSDRSYEAWVKLKNIVLNAEGEGGMPWWRRWMTRNYAMCVVLYALSALVWYEVYQIAKYGIMTFACPIKVNVGIWVGLSQLLVLLNVGCRHCGLDVRTIHLCCQ